MGASGGGSVGGVQGKQGGGIDIYGHGIALKRGKARLRPARI